MRGKCSLCVFSKEEASKDAAAQPSRSSTLTGKLVHNHGYWINGDPTYKTFVNWAGHNNNTVGTWLTAAGYHTAFLGSECARWPAPLGARSASLLTARRGARRAEYINTFECVPNPISPLTGQQAWSYWYATCNTCKSRQRALRTLLCRIR